MSDNESSSSDDGGTFTFRARRFNSGSQTNEFRNKDVDEEEEEEHSVDSSDDDFRSKERKRKVSSRNCTKTKMIDTSLSNTSSNVKSDLTSSSNAALSISLLESSDEELDASTYAYEVETETIKKAKIARMHLMASAVTAEVIDLDDESLGDDYKTLTDSNRSSLMQSGRLFEGSETQRDDDDTVGCILLDDDSSEETSPKIETIPRIKLKLRINGNDSEIDIFSVSISDPFQKLFDAFCRKRGVSSNQVKYSLDGDMLNSQSNCRNEDLEGGELIDVTITGEYNKYVT